MQNNKWIKTPYVWWKVAGYLKNRRNQIYLQDPKDKFPEIEWNIASSIRITQEEGATTNEEGDKGS